VRARRKVPGLPYERPPVIDAQIRPADELAASRSSRKSVRPPSLRSRLRYPPGCFRVASCAEEPAKEREAIPSPEPETGGVRCEGVCERGWVVVDAAMLLVAGRPWPSGSCTRVR
jgi:hypothetical protein